MGFPLKKINYHYFTRWWQYISITKNEEAKTKIRNHNHSKSSTISTHFHFLQIPYFHICHTIFFSIIYHLLFLSFLFNYFLFPIHMQNNSKSIILQTPHTSHKISCRITVYSCEFSPRKIPKIIEFFTTNPSEKQ